MTGILGDVSTVTQTLRELFECIQCYLGQPMIKKGIEGYDKITDVPSPIA